jgi:hypothetical protein
MGSEFMRKIGVGDPSTGGDFIREVVEENGMRMLGRLSIRMVCSRGS